MSTTQKALEQVENRRLPYWKLYKGSNRVAQCDSEENPDKDPELALELLEKELGYLSDEPGQYMVNVYRAINGEKGGFKYTFTIFPTERMNSLRNRPEPSPLDESLRDRIRREIEMDMRLKRIEEKLDAIIELAAARATDGKEDDDTALKFITTLAASAMKQKAGIAPKSGGFSGL
jgi:hypothetical protein